MKSDLITYVMIVFVIIMAFKIYRESDVFQLKCIDALMLMVKVIV